MIAARMVRIPYAAPLAFVLLAAGAHAQLPEHQGMVGTLAYTRIALDVADRADTRRDGATLLATGYRFPVPVLASRPLSITPQLFVTGTHLRGVGTEPGDVAHSTAGIGLQVAARISRVRPYFLTRWGTSTIERYEAGTLVNRAGGSRLFGAGIEIPMLESGRGFDIMYSSAKGRFTQTEVATVITPASLTFDTRTLLVGWSGRFRGTDWLFR